MQYWTAHCLEDTVYYLHWIFRISPQLHGAIWLNKCLPSSYLYACQQETRARTIQAAICISQQSMPKLSSLITHSIYIFPHSSRPLTSHIWSLWTSGTWRDGFWQETDSKTIILENHRATVLLILSLEQCHNIEIYPESVAYLPINNLTFPASVGTLWSPWHLVVRALLTAPKLGMLLKLALPLDLLKVCQNHGIWQTAPSNQRFGLCPDIP